MYAVAILNLGEFFFSFLIFLKMSPLQFSVVAIIDIIYKQELTKFGYRSKRKIEKLRILLCFGIQNMTISEKKQISSNPGDFGTFFSQKSSYKLH